MWRRRNEGRRGRVRDADRRLADRARRLLYTAGSKDHFDPEPGLDATELREFIGAAQADEWHRPRTLLGGSADDAQRACKVRLAREIDAGGTADVLRHGVVDHGVTIRLAYSRHQGTAGQKDGVLRPSRDHRAGSR